METRPDYGKVNTVYNLSAAMSEIPICPTKDDMYKQLQHCESEHEEVEEAIAEWEANPNNATFAHMAEEVADCIVSNYTLLKLMERMEECPCADYANVTMLFTYLKNKRRGYND